MAISFRTVDHVIPGQHIREYPNGTKHNQEDILQLSIRQYVPLHVPKPLPKNSITIIGVHGNGFPKVSAVEHALRSNGLNRVRAGMLRALVGRFVSPLTLAQSVYTQYMGGRLF